MIERCINNTGLEDKEPDIILNVHLMNCADVMMCYCLGMGVEVNMAQPECVLHSLQRINGGMCTTMCHLVAVCVCVADEAL